ncbi:Transition state regulatory protein AbrB [compost metagenome]|jgi:transcriptional pleiotropic regulator of transition state genes
MGIDIKDPLEIFVDGEKIILRKYEPTCIFSGSAENLINFKGKMVSKDVLDELISSFDRV